MALDSEDSSRALASFVFAKDQDGNPRFGDEQRRSLLTRLVVGMILQGKGDLLPASAKSVATDFLKQKGVDLQTADKSTLVNALERALTPSNLVDQLASGAAQIISKNAAQRQVTRAKDAHRKMGGETGLGGFVQGQQTPKDQDQKNPLQLRFSTTKKPS
jgi:hypothetical protein